MRVIVFGAAERISEISVDSFGRWDALLDSPASKYIGGAGFDIAVACRRAGMETALAARIGETDGAEIMKALGKEGVDTAYVTAVMGPCSHRTVQLRGAARMSQYEGAIELWESEIETALNTYGEGDWAIVVDDMHRTPLVIETAKARGMKVIYNPGYIRTEMLDHKRGAGADYVWLDMAQAAVIVNEPRDIYAARAVSRLYGADVVLNSSLLCGIAVTDDEITAHTRRRVNIADARSAEAAYIAYFLRAVTDGAPNETANRLGLSALCDCLRRRGAYKSLPEIDGLMQRISQTKDRRKRYEEVRKKLAAGAASDTGAAE